MKNEAVECIQAKDLINGDWICAFNRRFVVHSTMLTDFAVFVDTHEPGSQKSIKFTFDNDFAVPIDIEVHNVRIKELR